ncbi:S-layer homology domain-containing protein [Aeromicrobium sp. Sec7.5]|uniref:S-layer homology domain-containing protein n=1 Tax=Aeromicrobium sp. Sec7.5 TaxID=3121276 RepID=UPI002FE4AE39
MLRPSAGVAPVLLVLGLLVAGGPVQASPATSRAPAVAQAAHVGQPCAPGEGVTVVIDYGDLAATVDDPIAVSCAPGAQASGLTALTNSGNPYMFHPRFPGFVCSINGVGDPSTCLSPGWTYWRGVPDGEWTYSSSGAGATTPGVDTVEGWRYQTSGTTNLPPAVGPSVPIVFDDVAGTTFQADIEWLVAAGITTGYDNGDGTVSFRGSQAVLREQMAAFLYRFEHDGANPPSSAPSATFSDARTNTFTKHIAWLAGEGVTTGYPDGTFRPSAPVLREQMAAFLYRLAGEPDFTPPATSPFADVPTTSTFYREITWLAEQRVTTGYREANGATTFRGAQPVLREQMAAFLNRFDELPSER